MPRNLPGAEDRLFLRSLKDGDGALLRREKDSEVRVSPKHVHDTTAKAQLHGVGFHNGIIFPILEMVEPCLHPPTIIITESSHSDAHRLGEDHIHCIAPSAGRNSVNSVARP